LAHFAGKKPKDMLAGRQQEIHAELEEARKQRQIRRQQAV